MQLFIVGIQINFLEYQTTEKQVDVLIDSLKDIYSLGMNAFSKNVVENKDTVILVALREGALSCTAIKNSLKKSALHRLQQAVNDYPNMILIPGSFSTYEEISSYEKHSNWHIKSDKIISNYILNLLQFKKGCGDKHLKGAYEDSIESMENRINKNKDAIILKNSCYLLTANQKNMKRKKSYPFKENRLFQDEDCNFVDYVFDVGCDDVIKNIKVGKNEISIAPIICYESIHITKETIKKNPLIYLLISDSIKMNKEKAFGAINILLDSRSGLSVYIDENHTQRHKIKEVKALYYGIVANDKILSLNIPVQDSHDYQSPKRLTPSMEHHLETLYQYHKK